VSNHRHELFRGAKGRLLAGAVTYGPESSWWSLKTRGRRVAADNYAEAVACARRDAGMPAVVRQLRGEDVRPKDPRQTGLFGGAR